MITERSGTPAFTSMDQHAFPRGRTNADERAVAVVVVLLMLLLFVRTAPTFEQVLLETLARPLWAFSALLFHARNTRLCISGTVSYSYLNLERFISVLRRGLGLGLFAGVWV